MPIFLQNWLERSRPDYCLMFIHAWIPFNAWFRDVFYDTNSRNGDRELIDRLKTQPNKVKNRIISLLVGNNDDSVIFRGYITRLHEELSGHAIVQNGRRIGLNTTCITDNATNNKTISSRCYYYKCVYNLQAARGTNRIRCEVISRRRGNTKYLIELPDWSLDNLHTNPDFQALEEKHRLKMEDCFNEINPKKPELIVHQVTANSDGSFTAPRNTITIDKLKGVFFVNDTDKVSQVIIQLLYNMRCAIFHGEVEPTDVNMRIYEPAYYILSMLNQELI